jgi:archaellum component FlaF (FlaF/FlaG flagellin family)
MVNSSYKNHLNRKRGISTIVGGIIFLVLLTAGFSTFFVAMDVQSDTVNAQRAVSDSIIEKTQEDFEIKVTSDDFDNYKLAIQVKNEGPNPVQISNIWIINKSEANEPATSQDVNYDDAFIIPGDETQILEKTPIKMKHGEHDIKVVSVLGTIVTEKKFDPLNPGFGGPGESTGNIFMEFTSFEFCEPALDDCTSNSPDWVTAWDGKQDTKYIYRINIANRGNEDIIIEQTTSLFTLHAQTQGGGNLPRTFFIMADSTPVVENSGAYIAGSKIILKDGTPILLYFGVDDDGGTDLQASRNTAGINAVFLLIFGHQDTNDNGIYDNPGDPPYSQNLAYQGLRLI